MGEQFDVYSDNMRVTTSPWGTSLMFGLNAIPPAEADEPPIDLGVVRMSNQQLKVAIFVLWRNVLQHEKNVESRYDVSAKVLEGAGVDVQQWNAFWHGGGTA